MIKSSISLSNNLAKNKLFTITISIKINDGKSHYTYQRGYCCTLLQVRSTRQSHYLQFNSPAVVCSYIQVRSRLRRNVTLCVLFMAKPLFFGQIYLQQRIVAHRIMSNFFLNLLFFLRKLLFLSKQSTNGVTQVVWIGTLCKSIREWRTSVRL